MSRSCLKWLLIAVGAGFVLFIAALFLLSSTKSEMAQTASPIDVNADENVDIDLNAAINATYTNANTADTNAMSTAPMPTKVGHPPPKTGTWKGFGFPNLNGIFGGSSDSEPEEGVGRFADPGPMVLGNWYPLKFVAAPNVRATIMEIPDANLTAPQPIYLSTTMRVTLLPDPNFETTPATDAVQNTGRDLTQTWQWNVKPLHDGMHSLTARVEAGEPRKDGSFNARESRTRTVTIRVKIGTWEGFVRALGRASSLGDVLATLFASWEKTLLALGGLITAIGVVWTAIRKFRGKPILPRRRRKSQAAE
jgi:hypothetical protein